MTLDQLQKILPNAGPRAGVFVGPLNAAMEEFEITTPERVAMFIAQVAHETRELNALVENMNYSAAGLRGGFSKYFDAEAAAEYARQPERIGNRAYANRMGNGDEASGHGFRFRGRGLLHATGRDMYAKLSDALGLPLIGHPELLERPEEGSRAGAWIWAVEKDLNPIADRGDFRLITKRINGGLNGWDDRVKYLELAQRALAS